MSAGLVLEFQGVDASHYEAANKQLGIDMATGKGDWPAGLLSHAGGPMDGGGFAVIEVWASRQAQEEFMRTRLGAALQAAGLPEPSRVTWVDLLAYHTP